MLRRNKWLRPLLLITLAAVIITEIVALTPTALEEPKAGSTAIEPSSLVQDNEPTLISEIPKNRIAEYSIEKFHYVSVQNGMKQWRIESKKAFMYNPERMVHARGVTAYLYDPEGKITTVVAQEARYFLNQKDLELYGQVQTRFPDEFQVQSEYMRYRPEHRHIAIPTRYFTSGQGEEIDGKSFQFESNGLNYYMNKSLVELIENARVNLLQKTRLDTNGVPDKTMIESDHCWIHRDKNLALFTMNPKKPLATRFVHITQPTLFTRSRRADLNYGDFSQVIKYLVAYDDVLIKEIPQRSSSNLKPDLKKETSLRYATGGRADFDTRKDIIVLTLFPQVYQNGDTVTGDVILMHRDTDIVEIEHSNSFSEGSSQ